MNLGIIGHGQSAELMVAGFQAQPGVGIRWLIGPMAEPAAAFAAERGIPHSGTDFEAVLADEAVDAVVICTPHQLHFDLARRALRAGKHAIVEVPLTMNYDQAAELVRVAAEYGCQLSVPHIARYLPLYAEARRLIETGDVGRVFQLVYRRLWYQRAVGQLLRRPRSWLDTVAWHHAAHAVDLAMWLLGESMDCVGAIIGRDRTLQNEVDLSANFLTPTGTMVTLALSYNARQEILDAVVVGENCLLEMAGFSVLRRQGLILVEEANAATAQSQAYGRYISAAVAGLRGESPMPVTGAEILPTMAVLQRMHDLAATLRVEPADRT